MLRPKRVGCGQYSSLSIVSCRIADGQHILTPSSAEALPRRRWLRARWRSRLKIREPMGHATSIPTSTAAVR